MSSFGTSFVSRFGRLVLNGFFPPSCAACGADVETAGLFCHDCFGAAQRIISPSCRKCGVPLASEGFGGADCVCVSCQVSPPVWRFARAAFVYDEWSRRLILPMKYSDRTENAAVLAREIMRYGHDLLGPDVVLVPVPMHRRKVWRRRYNQAALLAQALGRLSGARVCVDGLWRRKSTRALAHLSAKERQAEMVDTIDVRPHRQNVLSGQAVVLVDDVLTTGATATVCTNALLKIGVRTVDILVAARTSRRNEQDVPYPEE